MYFILQLQEEITMMEMLGLSVPSIIHNQSVVSTKQESTQTVFFAYLCVIFRCIVQK